VKDATEPNKYVPELAACFQRVITHLNDAAKGGRLPHVSRLAVWSTIVSHVMERFVEAYSRVPKCSVLGRGLMSTDVGHLHSALSKMGPTHAAVLARDKAFVDTYISAFYLDTEAEVQQWVFKHKAAYALRHVQSVIVNGIGSSGKVKRKQVADLAAMVESQYLLAATTPAAGGTGGGRLGGLGMGMGGLGMGGLGLGGMGMGGMAAAFGMGSGPGGAPGHPAGGSV